MSGLSSNPKRICHVGLTVRTHVKPSSLPGSSPVCLPAFMAQPCCPRSLAPSTKAIRRGPNPSRPHSPPFPLPSASPLHPRPRPSSPSAIIREVTHYKMLILERCAELAAEKATTTRDARSALWPDNLQALRSRARRRAWRLTPPPRPGATTSASTRWRKRRSNSASLKPRRRSTPRGGTTRGRVRGRNLPRVRPQPRRREPHHPRVPSG